VASLKGGDNMLRPNALVLAVFAMTCGVPVIAQAGVAVGEPMPRFAVQSWEGQRVDIDPTNSPVLVVEFWATWCQPCRALLPAMAKMVASIDDARLRVIAINVESDAAAVERYLDIHLPQRGLPLYRDPDNRLMSQFGAPGMPVIYVVVEGVVRAIEAGYSEQTHQTIERLVRSALASDH